jgi:aryl sulfotransferase
MANTDFDALAKSLAGQIGKAALRGQFERMPQTPESKRERFWSWVEDQTPVQQTGTSLQAVLNLLASFWTQRNNPNVVLLHYDDLKADLEGQMRALARRLSIRIPEDRWPELVKAATFNEMRGSAEKFAPGVTESLWRDNTQFFHRGSSGQWRRLFDETELAQYDARVRELVEPDLAEWLHRLKGIMSHARPSVA